MPFLKVILWAFFLVVCQDTFAQHLQGISLSNYAGTNALYHNPALVADSRYNIHANLIGANAYIGNNHVKWNAPYSFARFATNSVGDEHVNAQGKISFPRTYLDQKINGNDKFINAGLDLRLPAIMFSLKEGKYGIGFTSRARFLNNVSNTSEDIARLLSGTPQDPSLHGQKFTGVKSDLQLNAVGEYAITLGGVILDNGDDVIKIGATIKRLVGVAHTHIQIKDASYELVPDPSTGNQIYMLSATHIHANTGYTTDNGISTAGFRPDWLMGKSSPGAGWAMDLGVVYEYRPHFQKHGIKDGLKGWKMDPSANKYLYRIAASITDIGRFGFNNIYYNLAQNNINASGSFPYNNYKGIGSMESFYNAIAADLKLPTPTEGNFDITLPTTFQLSADYNIRPNVYVSGLWIQSLRASNTFGMRPESVLAITPRYEHKWYEVSIPISIMNHYRSFGVGIAGRVGPIWIGADHLTGLLNIGNPKAMTVYAGISMGIFQKPLDNSLPCWPPPQKGLKRFFQRN